MSTSYFLGRETLIPTPSMTRNATSASTFFNLPPNQVIELGAQVQI